MAQYDVERTLAANEEIIIDCSASNRYQVMSADAEFFIKPDGQGRIRTELGVGQKIKGGFDKLWIQNGSTAQTIYVKIGDDEIIDNRMVGTVDISGGIRAAGNQSSSYGAVSVGAAATLIAASDSDRSSILIQNLGTSPIFVGPDNAVTVANGIMVDAGGSMPFTLQTTVYGISAIAGQDVRYLDEGVV